MANHTSQQDAPRGPVLPATRFSGSTLFHLVVLSGAALALYALGLRNGFVADDQLEVLQDPLIRSFRLIPQMFAHSVWYFHGAKADRYYRPLKLLAYSVEYRLFHFHPALWHLANIFFNVAAVLVVYFLVRDLANRQLAFWSAVLFAFHPIHVEAVAWIAAGNDLECGLLLLLALWLYHRARQGRSPGPNYTISAILFFAALLFKETALTFPAVLFCYEYFYRRESLASIARGGVRYAAYFAVLLVYLGMRWHALGRFAATNPDNVVTGTQFALTAPVLAAQYLWKSLVPIHLNAWYTFDPVSTLGWKSVAATVLLAFLVWAVFRLRRRQPLLSFALAWFWLTLIPVLDIPKVGLNVFAERYLYIPTVGFCILSAWMWLSVLERATRPTLRRAAYAGIAALLAFYSVVLVRRLPDWHDDVSLWAKTAAQDPGDPVVLNATGTAYFSRGQYGSALEMFQRAVAISPDKAYTHNSLGGAYFAFHRYDDAQREFQKAVALSPDSATNWSNLGVAYANKNMWPESVAAFRNAVDRYSRSTPALPGILGAESQANLSELYVQYGAALLNAGQIVPAKVAFRNAVQADPANLDARIRLAGALAQQGQLDAAAAQISAGLRANPGSPQAYLAHYNLSRIYQQQGLGDAAMQERQRALALNPGLGATPVQVSPLHLAAPGKGKPVPKSGPAHHD